KKYLALAVLLCGLLSLSNASCEQQKIKNDKYLPPCQDDMDKTWHAVGSTWRNSKCMNCNCRSCSDMYSTPIRFPNDCVKVFDPEACAYVVHKRDDPSVLCPVMGSFPHSMYQI
uniref:Beta-microseminoprotein n=1 Tax=Lates calcarifer TaxID=8187 RepID=A0A4W6G8A7_LATCA